MMKKGLLALALALVLSGTSMAQVVEPSLLFVSKQFPGFYVRSFLLAPGATRTDIEKLRLFHEALKKEFRQVLSPERLPKRWAMCETSLDAWEIDVSNFHIFCVSPDMWDGDDPVAYETRMETPAQATQVLSEFRDRYGKRLVRPTPGKGRQMMI